METETTQCEYDKHALKRAEYTETILNSIAPKKLIVAGPGTGKSFLFQQICKRKLDEGKSKILALSFINELVDDLSKDLYQLADVKTLHSFALSKIPRDKNMFFHLGNVIEGDYTAIFDKHVNFNRIFCNLINDQESLNFYSKRRKYYNFFSPNCAIYTLIKMFEIDEKRIPKYSLILIDEFQDFNRLESRFLSFLSKKSPVVIVGDDDQSLYDFKYADPSEIRKKYKSKDFEAFELPYCSRCTKGIIDAYTRIIDTAQSNGYLQDRVPKKYLYFPSEQKDCCSLSHPKIVVKRKVFQKTIAYNIDSELKALFDPRAEHLPTVLIICPLKKQIESVEKGLRAKGFKNVNARERFEPTTIMEGFNLLLKNGSCNLAWRILFEAECQRTDNKERFKQVIKESLDSNIPFKDFLLTEERRTIKKVNAALRKIKNGKNVDDETLDEIFTVLGYSPIQIAQSQVRDALVQESAKKNIYQNTPIKIVTILGAKGLTRDYTFLVNFDDRFLLDRSDNKEMKITDGGICKFLVALTRAKERVYIYTSKNEYPTYVKWITDELIYDCTEE